MTLEELQKLPFLRASKFEKTSTTLLIRSKDRTLTQADVEKYLTKNTIKFTRLPKPTEILIPGGKKIIFKPLKFECFFLLRSKTFETIHLLR